MVFNSYAFLCFFPIVTLIYFVLPMRIRWVWLLAASYYFYMCWNAKYALLIALSTVVTYTCALLAERHENRGIRRLVMIAGLVINLGILVFFKYGNFFGETLNRLVGVVGLDFHIPRVNVLLPVGISFYTFQALGYMLDVYRGEIKAEKNLFRYALFVSFFPQLVAGPIERSKNLLHQVNHPRRWNPERARDGLCLVLLGMFEKIVIADRAALYVDAVFDHWVDASGMQIVLATVLFAFQIYGDFGGYSHMAIGTAKVLGFDLMENFRQPYFAVSVRDFWRRWHVSLSTWFRDYVYIPLGGSRVSPLRRAVNTMITFSVSGLWHGASLNYVVWGMLNGALQVLEGILPGKKKPGKDRLPIRALKTAVTFVVICCTWFFFRVNALSTGLKMIRRIFFCFFGPPVATPLTVYQGILLALSIALLMLLDLLHESGRSLTQMSKRWPSVLTGALSILAALAIVLFGIWGPGYSAQAFIYFVF